MQFLYLVIINLVMGFVFYLVISLKLEKNASEFREQKFRKEMDAVIREFNATAETNISILENKIEVMKKLLKQSDTYTEFDLTVDSNGIKKSLKNKNEQNFNEKKEKVHNDVIERPLEVDHNFTGRINNFIKKKNSSKKNPDMLKSVDDDIFSVKKKTEQVNELVDDNLLELLRAENKKEAEKNIETNELLNKSIEDIAEMFNNAEDKHQIITDLYLAGWQIDDIAKCAGMSAAEIQLILSLNNIH